MPDVRLPDLTFPGVSFSPLEVPWDLRPWLYRGGAKANAKEVSTLIENEKLGRPLNERIELVRSIHEALLNSLGRGETRSTVFHRITTMRCFFQWADNESGAELSLDTVEVLYRNWCDALLHRARVAREIKEYTAYTYCSGVGTLLDKVLERATPLIRTTRIKRRTPSPRAVSPKADKQNLQEAFAFGHFLLDLADGLSVHAIWGSLPVRIPLRNGKTLEDWSGRIPITTLKTPNPNRPAHRNRSNEKRSARLRAAWEAEKSFRTRYSLINLRIMAEMLMLMGQPGVNLAQAHQLRMDQWRYKSSKNGYEVRTYKHRRSGSVVFEIYSEYRAVFERYLAWRKLIFPNDPDGLVFPLIGCNGKPAQRRLDRAPSTVTFQRVCKRAGVKYVSPQALRSTNVNWMLRRSGDPELTAQEKQHSKQTLLRVYERPSLQRALVQTQVFWDKYDPALAAPGPGTCKSNFPEPISEIPTSAPRPDCTTPAGCLFCVHQRDIDSFDHVWSLETFRYLKVLEQSKTAASESAALATIDRITSKLDTIKASSAKRAEWVQEVRTRTEEGRFHPAWEGLITSL